MLLLMKIRQNLDMIAEDLPTGSYVVQTSSDGSTMKLGMLNQGTITVTEDQHVVIDAYTTEGISVKET